METTTTNNVTTRDIVAIIEDEFDGEVLEFLQSFFYVCNGLTTFGVPRMYAPLDDDISLSFGGSVLTLRVRDVASSYFEECMYEVEQLLDDTREEFYTVCVKRYAYDKEFEELYPFDDFAPLFDVSDPADLARLCHYVGVTFQPSYFDFE